ncbi:hypothetical protein KUTeg_008502 [Tegillarca granosa]|uniref:Uncharacterized protein n=1 Tax=Tegillarca granosa TaxID=220873 RepID=A0ABQ9F9B0_TEGGR|nr:hypothetical protein KUTeg_008502 [Tegillarca granosa]
MKDDDDDDDDDHDHDDDHDDDDDDDNHDHDVDDDHLIGIGNHVKSNYINQASSDSELAKHRAKQLTDSLDGNVNIDPKSQQDKDGIIPNAKICCTLCWMTNDSVKMVPVNRVKLFSINIKIMYRVPEKKE